MGSFPCDRSRTNIHGTRYVPPRENFLSGRRPGIQIAASKGRVAVIVGIRNGMKQLRRLPEREVCIMYVQTGKTFIATLIAVVLAMSGLAWLSSDGKKAAPTALAQSSQLAQTSAQDSAPAGDSSTSANNSSGSSQSTYEDGYRSGYRDGQQDCATAGRTSSSYSARRTYYAPRYRARRGVAGARYYGPVRRGHSTRNMILTIAGPAAVGAGIGAIARGGKGAGIGALLGGGGGALYYLFKHRRD